MKKKLLKGYDSPQNKRWKLRLFVTDEAPRCVAAYHNLKNICKEHLSSRCEIEVVDILEDPEIARREQIIAVPTLMKILPEPKRLLVGDFTLVENVLKGLDVTPRKASQSTGGQYGTRHKKAA